MTSESAIAAGITRRIGLFGGTFDPVHRGHLQVARQVRARFDLETVYFIPAALPPHKSPAGMADAEDRMAMIRLAISPFCGLAVSDVELKRAGPSYTVDTVAHFKSLFSEDTGLMFILGIDAFLEIGTWKSYRALLTMIPFIVVSRPAHARGSRDAGKRDVEKMISRGIDAGYRFVSEKGCYIHDNNQPVCFLDIDPVPISSTQIRGRIRNGRPIHRMVPDTVEKYIYNRGLYR